MSELSATILLSLRQAFVESLPLWPATETHLRDALLQALHHPGSMVRAQMMYAVATHYGIAPDNARKLAVAIEYFHTASLIFDDLPCMDDAAKRRGAPCLHRTHGEATAMLAALGLVNRAYALAWQVIQSAPPAQAKAAGDYLERCLGVAGVLNGQSQDRHYDSLPAGERAPQKVALGKTVLLIQLPLVLPALLGGASAVERKLLERLATFWGLIYQMFAEIIKFGLPGTDMTGHEYLPDTEIAAMARYLTELSTKVNR